MFGSRCFRLAIVGVLSLFLSPIGVHETHAQFGGGMGGGMGGELPVMHTGPTRFDDLIRVITATIESDSWEQMGGPGSIQVVDDWGLLFVNQTTDVHEQIKDLLDVVRRVRTQSGIAKEFTQPVAYALESEVNSISRESIERALGEVTALEFFEQPLGDAIREIQDRHDIAMIIDVAALEELGLTPDVPITKSVRGVSLRAALKLMLRDLELTYAVRDGIMCITTRERAESDLITLVYPVEDLAIRLQTTDADGESEPEPSEAVNPEGS